MFKTHGIAISIASKGSPCENALAKRVNDILKQGYGLGKVIEVKIRPLLLQRDTGYRKKELAQAMSSLYRG